MDRLCFFLVVVQWFFYNRLQYATSSCILTKIQRIYCKSYYNLFQTGQEIEPGFPGNIVLLDTSSLKCKSFLLKSTINFSILQFKVVKSRLQHFCSSFVVVSQQLFAVYSLMLTNVLCSNSQVSMHDIAALKQIYIRTQ